LQRTHASSSLREISRYAPVEPPSYQTRSFSIPTPALPLYPVITVNHTQFQDRCSARSHSHIHSSANRPSPLPFSRIGLSPPPCVAAAVCPFLRWLCPTSSTNHTELPQIEPPEAFYFRCSIFRVFHFHILRFPPPPNDSPLGLNPYTGPSPPQCRTFSPGWLLENIPCRHLPQLRSFYPPSHSLQKFAHLPLCVLLRQVCLLNSHSFTSIPSPSSISLLLLFT